MPGTVTLDWPSDSVARLTIANPTKRGALDHTILDGIVENLHVLSGSQARCVIVTGEKNMFSAGYDIGNIPDSEFAQTSERLVAHPFTDAIDQLEAFPYPTIAALCGHTIGGGLELSLACDIRIASKKIKLGMPPAKLGLVYSHTGLRRFLNAIGEPRTRELFLLGHYIDASTALHWGLVNRVAETTKLEQETLEIANELAGNSPRSQRDNKKILRALLDEPTQLSKQTEQLLIELRKASFRSDDMREGVRAFAEKRPPNWCDS